ncbi:MAG: hypothetical protein JNK56_15775 [Myxococcales bacterium]|nr:hypothetical protein [Myxococcales bacterium]
MNPIDLRNNDLRATTSLADGVLQLALTGTADASSEVALGGLLTRIQAELLSHEVHEARVDMRRLEFMNSSCFKAFITWITVVAHLPPARRHRIRFLCNPALHWQRRSLKAMVHFGNDIVTVETG